MPQTTSASEKRAFSAVLCCGGAEPISHSASAKPILLGAASPANLDDDARKPEVVEQKQVKVEVGGEDDGEKADEAVDSSEAQGQKEGSLQGEPPRSSELSSGSLQDRVAVAAHARRLSVAPAATPMRYSVAPMTVTQLYGLSYSGKSSFIRLRWNLLWAVFALFGLYPFLGAIPSACSGVYATTLTLSALQAILLTIGAVSCWVYMVKMWWATKVNWTLLAGEKCGDDAVDRVRHVFVLPAYKEPLELLENTVATVADQTIAKKIVMVVTLEESSPTLAMAKQRLPKQFNESFAKVIVTMHPKGLPDEIPGACSNRNWGVRRAVQILDEEFQPDDESTLITVCDSDTVFHRRYAECLTHKFLTSKDRVDKVYQSPLFYNLSLDERYFFTRVTAVIRAFLMVGFLIPMSINTMSIYSIPLPLLKKAKFFHPGYQMDDIIFTLSAMQAIGKRVFIQLIEVPTLSGPTSGDSFREELSEWYVQAKRWTIGAGEVFHYFFIKLLKRRFTLMSGISYGIWLTLYYAFFLCAFGIVTLTSLLTRLTAGLADPRLSMESCLEGTFWDFGVPFPAIDLTIMVYTYFTFFGTAFVMDKRLVSVLKLRERVSCSRTLMHFLLAQAVLWGYCVVECVSIAVLSVYGKKVCGHKPSNKDSLVKK